MSSIEKAVISTICYFDITDYPLTLMEIWKWLFLMNDKDSGDKIDLSTIQKTLEKSEYIRNRIESKSGFYFLRGRRDLVNIRKKRYNIAEQKYKRAIRIIRFLRFIPFIKMIAVCNTLAYSNSRQNADIDLFIITKHQRIWQTRFWVTGLLKIFGLRPSQKRIEDTFCSSFFVDEDNLNLKKLAIENDIYLLYWITQVFPVYDQGVYQHFMKENRWIRDKLVNFQAIRPSYRRKLARVRGLKNIFEAVGRLLPESIFKSYQLRIMPAKLRKMANKDSRVVIQDFMLKFHDIDRRKEFRDQFQKRQENVIRG